VESNDAQWPVEGTHTAPMGKMQSVVPDQLRQVATGTMTLPGAFVVLTCYQEEQTRIESDLRDREIWALTALLEAGGTLWTHFDRPTLVFRLPGSDNVHLEVGHFSHLATLCEPSPEEQLLAMSSGVTWAKVSPHAGRYATGQRGPLAYSYVPIPMADAVAILGFGAIVRELEAVTRSAGSVMLQRAQALQERQAQLVTLERAIGWEAEGSLERAEPASRHGLQGFLAHGLAVWRMTDDSAVWAPAAILCLLLGLLYVGAVLVVTLLGLAS
jgi:hypothetical protein